MNAPPPPPAANDPLEAAAAQWLARRDRRLTPAEQDEYLQWLRQDPRHPAAIARLEKTWVALEALARWRPDHSAVPNPDLLAPPRRFRRHGRALLLAAAAALALAGYFWRPAPAAVAAPRVTAIIHPAPARQTLPDGSVVELNQGARIEVRFTPGERHVQLVRGEAHFTVAKNPDRPFFVDTDKVSVRAVGTAFNVMLARNEVAVLVTEGKVQVLEHSPLDAKASPRFMRLIALRRPIVLVGGQRTVVRLETEPAPREAASGPVAAPAAPVVQDVTPAEIERALSWQGMRLEFVDMPLGDVVAEFNRFNRQHLVVRDPDTAAILVGGNFRADNVDGFVRLLEAGFDVQTEPQGGNHLLLRRKR